MGSLKNKVKVYFSRVVSALEKVFDSYPLEERGMYEYGGSSQLLQR